MLGRREHCCLVRDADGGAADNCSGADLRIAHDDLASFPTPVFVADVVKQTFPF